MREMREKAVIVVAQFSAQIEQTYSFALYCMEVIFYSIMTLFVYFCVWEYVCKQNMRVVYMYSLRCIMKAPHTQT